MPKWHKTVPPIHIIGLQSAKNKILLDKCQISQYFDYMLKKTLTRSKVKRISKHLLFALVLLAFIPAAHAFESTVTLQGGVGYAIDDFDQQDTEYFGTWGVAWDAWLKHNLALGINPYFTKLKSMDGLSNYKSDIEGVDVYLKLRPTKILALNFNDKAIINRISPFIALGAGYAHYDGKGDVNGDGIPNDDEAYMAVLPHAAAGISMLTKWNTTFDLGVKYNYTDTDQLDFTTDGDWNDGYLMPYAGIGIHFGGVKDKDKDGIEDKYDKAPRDPEDFDGYMDNDGAPDPDNDGDGILDVNDGAPNEPEDIDGYKDDDGIPDPDNDKDGILDKNDKAPNDPEDIDGYMDADGIPDPDNDKDGILDKNDKAPNEPEDIDGFQDKDGAPDLDNDNDGIPDKNDKAPGTDQTVRDGIDTKETYNGYQDEDGVPDVKPDVTIKDSDGDGIPDDKDKAPNDAEDIDGYMDMDGIPDLDNDGDKIPDKKDKAPGTDQTVRDGIDTKETYNGYMDEDGIPDTLPETPKPPVEEQVKPTDLENFEKDLTLRIVHFDTNLYDISAADKLKLDIVAAGLKKLPQIKLQIQGHTDNTGPADFNEKLGLNRAKAVKDYLVSKGIEASRLEVKGFSFNKPVDSNGTPEGRANNRRADFTIIK